MPYITKERREELEKNEDIQTAGELNYLITKKVLAKTNKKYSAVNRVVAELEFEINSWVNSHIMVTKNCTLHSLCYKASKNMDNTAIVGALRCAQLEFYRRFAAPYEDLKIEENGDVY